MSEGRQYRIWVPGAPQAKGSPSILRHPRTWKPFVREKAPVVAWQDRIRLAARAIRNDHPEALPTDAPVSLDLTFILPRQQTAPKTKARTRELASTGLDLDKLCRAVFDALESEWFTNDARVCDLIAKKRVSFTETQPSVTIIATLG